MAKLAHAYTKRMKTLYPPAPTTPAPAIIIFNPSSVKLPPKKRCMLQ